MHCHCGYKGSIDLKLILKLAKVIVKMMFSSTLFDILASVFSFLLFIGFFYHFLLLPNILSGI
jgi:hypothetical protein